MGGAVSDLDPCCARSLVASELSSRSAHRLHGDLHTILGFAELLAEDGEESGPLLLEAARRLRVRLDAILHLHHRCHRPWSGCACAMDSLIDDLVLPAGGKIANRLEPHLRLGLDPRGLRALLAEIGALVAPSVVVIGGADGAVEIDTSLVAEVVADGDGAVTVAVIEALAADLGGTLLLTDAANGRRRITVRLPLIGARAE